MSCFTATGGGDATLSSLRFCGSVWGEANGTRLTARFAEPAAVCPDPRNFNTGSGNRGWYLAERFRIRYFDEKRDEVTLIAGCDRRQVASNRGAKVDGIGAAALFAGIAGIVIDSRGETIWCADRRGGLRSIDTKSGRVTTTSYHDAVDSVCWDRATVKPDSALYCLTLGDGGQIQRFDIASNSMAPPIVTGGVQQFVVTPTGHIIFATDSGTAPVDDSETSGIGISDLFVVDPGLISGVERLDQLRGFNMHQQLLLLDTNRTLMTFTASGDFLSYTLPSQYFPVAKCCDRDL